MPDTKEKPDVKTEILQMSFPQLLGYVNDMDNLASMPVCTALTQRLYEIALYDNHVPKEFREGALELLQILKSTVENTFKDNPTLLASYKQINTDMEENARRTGVGSLAWLILEHRISQNDDDKFISFLSRPEHRELLEDFYSIVGPEIATQIKQKLA